MNVHTKALLINDKQKYLMITNFKHLSNLLLKIKLYEINIAKKKINNNYSIFSHISQFFPRNQSFSPPTKK